MTCRHLHVEAIHFNIIASYEKRPGGEPFKAKGDYAVCDTCGQGMFLPYKKHLRNVPCEVEYMVNE